MENTEKMASQAQINYLQRLGYQGSTANLTAEQANNLIKSWSQRGQNQNTGYQAPQGFQSQQPTHQEQAAMYQQQGYGQAPAVSKNDVSVVTNLGIADDLLGNLTELANDGMLFIPENYSVGNALKSAMSKILTSDQADKLLACTAESKKQALTEYIVQGLDASKTQAYFIPYGNKMVMMRSYFGDVAVAKRTGLVKDVYAVVIYDGDEIEIGFDEYGRKTLISHKTKFENQDNDIVGAYAVIVGINGYKAYDFMTRKELEASWKMSKMPTGKLHTDYKQEAAKRTVIRRAVKMIFNTSLNTTEEQTALIGSYNRTTPDEYVNDENTISAEYKESTVDDVKAKQKNKTATKTIAPEDTEEWPE